VGGRWPSRGVRVVVSWARRWRRRLSGSGRQQVICIGVGVSVQGSGNEEGSRSGRDAGVPMGDRLPLYVSCSMSVSRGMFRALCLALSVCSPALGMRREGRIYFPLDVPVRVRCTESKTPTAGVTARPRLNPKP
jgi:hypothetical protein